VLDRHDAVDARAREGALEMSEIMTHRSRLVEARGPSAKLSHNRHAAEVAANGGTEPGQAVRLMKGRLDLVVMKALEEGSHAAATTRPTGAPCTRHQRIHERRGRRGPGHRAWATGVSKFVREAKGAGDRGEHGADRARGRARGHDDGAVRAWRQEGGGSRDAR